MNQNPTSEPKDTICSKCNRKDTKFLHHVWDGKKAHKLCTSCVLLTHKVFFCPTCFVVHDRLTSEKLVRCNKCQSRSHAKCFSANGGPYGAPLMCSTCIDPDRLFFRLKKLKSGENGYCKVIDMKAAGLLLTAAKIVKDSIFNAHDLSEYFGVVEVTKAVMEKKNVRNELERGMKSVESHVGPSLLDSSVGDDSGRMLRLSIEGATI